MAPMLSIRTSARELGRAGPALLDVWIYFNLVVNTILLPLLVGTFLFSPRAKRHPTLINLCITWILSGVFSLLLFYGKEHIGPEPNRALCIAQTTLLYGITPMWSVAVFMFFYYMVKAVSGDSVQLQIKKWKMILMLASPYIAQIAFSVATLCISLNHPNKVTREHRYFYCALSFPPLSLGMSLFTMIMCIGIVILEVHLGMIAYRNHRGLREAGQTSETDIQFFLRVLTFGCYITVGMAVNVVSIFAPSNVAPDMYAATAGTAVFLVFGTQPDVLSVWFFWRRMPRETAGPTMATKIDLRLRSNSDLSQDVPPYNPSYDISDSPPLPPPKSQEYLISNGLLDLGASGTDPEKPPLYRPL